MSLPEVATTDDPNVENCTIDGVDHDYRPHKGTQNGVEWTWWRCVWCHGVSCGNYTDPDPCWEPYHHHGEHRSRSGVVWPKGGDRP